MSASKGMPNLKPKDRTLMLILCPSSLPKSRQTFSLRSTFLSCDVSMMYVALLRTDSKRRRSFWMPSEMRAFAAIGWRRRVSL